MNDSPVDDNGKREPGIVGVDLVDDTIVDPSRTLGMSADGLRRRLGPFQECHLQPPLNAGAG
ncbi:MAG: hypothetical protein WBF03_23185 [Xanthobacteraceae bacterium]|jgi:hypothetical protein